MGSTIFEKHFTLTKSKKGNDHYHSFDTTDVIECLETLNYLGEVMSFDEQKFIEIQEKAIKFARRGLYANADIEPGRILQNSDITSLRPVPENGITASEILNLIGQKAQKYIKAGSPITIQDLKN